MSDKATITKGGSIIVGDSTYNLKSFSKIEKGKWSTIDQLNAEQDGQNLGVCYLEFTEQDGETWTLSYDTEAEADKILKQIQDVI